jgi:hypothetical protein
MTLPAAPRGVATIRESSWAGARVWIAVLAVMLYAAASTVRWVHRAAERPARSQQDGISAYERRFDELRPVLPDSGAVGYLGDPGPTGPSAILHFRRYLLAQYSLAPVLLIESTEPEFVIGNFEAGAIHRTPTGFRVVRHFCDGVMLFRRSAR